MVGPYSGRDRCHRFVPRGRVVVPPLAPISSSGPVGNLIGVLNPPPRSRPSGEAQRPTTSVVHGVLWSSRPDHRVVRSCSPRFCALAAFCLRPGRRSRRSPRHPRPASGVRRPALYVSRRRALLQRAAVNRIRPSSSLLFVDPMNPGCRAGTDDSRKLSFLARAPVVLVTVSGPIRRSRCGQSCEAVG